MARNAHSAKRLFDEIRAAGYTGGYTQLKQHVRGVRPAPPPEPLIRFETAAGHQAQVDFASFTLPWGRRYALLVVLGYSRLFWMHFYARQTMQTPVPWARSGVRILRRRSRRTFVRPDERWHHGRQAQRGRVPRRER
jgi:transposase